MKILSIGYLCTHCYSSANEPCVTELQIKVSGIRKIVDHYEKMLREREKQQMSLLQFRIHVGQRQCRLKAAYK